MKETYHVSFFFMVHLATNGCIDLVVDAMNSGLRIGTLKMGGEFVGDDEMGKLLSSDNGKYLLELDVNSNKMSRAGFEVLSSFLGQDSTNIERLDARSQVTSDIEYSRLLLGAISRNKKSTVKSICLRKIFNEDRHRGIDNDDHKTIEQLLKNIICKPPDINSLCKSNHQLHNIGYSTPYLKSHSKVIRMALEINEREQSIKSIE